MEEQPVDGRAQLHDAFGPIDEAAQHAALEPPKIGLAPGHLAPGPVNIRLGNHRWPPGEGVAVLKIEVVLSCPPRARVPCPLNLAAPLFDFFRARVGHSR